MIEVVVERLEKNHVRDAFDCGEPSLNDYLKRFARQNDAKNLGRTFVACRSESVLVAAYYSLSSGSIGFESLPDGRGLPKYPLPTSHIGRLAVDKTAQGFGLGAHMLIDALKRSSDISHQIGIFAVTVGALNDNAKQFYKRYGFEELVDKPNSLYLSIADVELVF